MTAYDDYNLPEDFNVESLPDGDNFTKGMQILKRVIDSDSAIVVSAEALKFGQVYDRKGFINSDTFGGRRNPSYSHEQDDIVIQYTVRVPRWRFPDFGVDIDDFEQQVSYERMREQREALDAEIAAEEEEINRLREKVLAKREARKELNGE